MRKVGTLSTIALKGTGKKKTQWRWWCEEWMRI